MAPYCIFSSDRIYLLCLSDELQTEESAVQKQQKSAWAPFLFFRKDKEEYYYAGHKIVIEGGFDSFGGMLWPAVSIWTIMSICP